MSEKAPCSVCLGEFVVKKDDTLRWHGNGVRVGPYARQMCPGAGKAPAVYHDPLGEDGWARALIARTATEADHG